MARLPSGSDPRLNLPPDELEAASVRALPDVARGSNMGDNLVLIGGIAGVLALGAITFVSLGSKPPAPPLVQQQQVPPPRPSVLPPIQPELNPPVEPAPQSLLTQPTVQPLPPPAPPVDNNAARAPALIIDNSTTSSGAPPAAATGPAGSVTLNANDQFAARVSGDVTQKAQKIGDPSKVVPQGAVIPAILETAINSDLPGYTRAIVSRDIRSFDGTAVLIPRGSRLVGQYKSGLASGETRAFIIWNRLIRPTVYRCNWPRRPLTISVKRACQDGSIRTSQGVSALPCYYPSSTDLRVH